MSSPGLTRRSRETSPTLRTAGWIAGSSPAMTERRGCNAPPGSLRAKRGSSALRRLEPVVLLGALRRDVAFGQVLLHHGPVALPRVAPAAAARRDQVDPVARAQRDVAVFAARALVERLRDGQPLLAAGVLHERRAVRPFLAAVETPGLDAVAVGHLAGRDRRAAAQQALAGRQAAAEPARAAGIGQQVPLLDQPRIAGLEDLDRHHAAIAVDRILGVVAVGGDAAAPTDHLDVVTGEVLVVLLVVAAEDEVDVR